MAQATTRAKEKNNTPAASRSTERGLTKRPSTGGGIARRGDLPVASPFSFFENFRNEMERVFDNFGFGLGRMPTFGGFGRDEGFQWSPETEVFERGTELVVRADLPGLTKDDISVDLDDDQITIRGERKSEHEEAQGGVYRSERHYGSFYRTIPLPEGVDGDKAKADFRDGVLEITMPKPEGQPRGRRLEIRG